MTKDYGWQQQNSGGAPSRRTDVWISFDGQEDEGRQRTRSAGRKSVSTARPRPTFFLFLILLCISHSSPSLQSIHHVFLTFSSPSWCPPPSSSVHWHANQLLQGRRGPARCSGSCSFYTPAGRFILSAAIIHVREEDEMGRIISILLLCLKKAGDLNIKRNNPAAPDPPSWITSNRPRKVKRAFSIYPSDLSLSFMPVSAHVPITSYTHDPSRDASQKQCKWIASLPCVT